MDTPSPKHDLQPGDKHMTAHERGLLYALLFVLAVGIPLYLAWQAVS